MCLSLVCEQLCVQVQERHLAQAGAAAHAVDKETEQQAMQHMMAGCKLDSQNLEPFSL